VAGDGTENAKASRSDGGFCYAPFSQEALEFTLSFSNDAIREGKPLFLRAHILAVITRNAGDEICAHAARLDDKNLVALFKKVKDRPLDDERRAKILSKFSGGNHAAVTPVSSDTRSEEPAAINRPPESPPARNEGVEDMDTHTIPARPRTAEPRPEEAGTPQPPALSEGELELIEKVAGTKLRKLAKKGLMFESHIRTVNERARLDEPNNKLKADERQAMIDEIMASQPAFDWKGFGKKYGQLAVIVVLLLAVVINFVSTPAVTPASSSTSYALEMPNGPVNGVRLADGTWMVRPQVLSPASGPLDILTPGGEINKAKWHPEVYVAATVVDSPTPGATVKSVEFRQNDGLNQLVYNTELRGNVTKEQLTIRPPVVVNGPIARR
jgi:hypothetical protein